MVGIPKLQDKRGEDPITTTSEYLNRFTDATQLNIPEAQRRCRWKSEEARGRTNIDSGRPKSPESGQRGISWSLGRICSTADQRKNPRTEIYSQSLTWLKKQWETIWELKENRTEKSELKSSTGSQQNCATLCKILTNLLFALFFTPTFSETFKNLTQTFTQKTWQAVFPKNRWGNFSYVNKNLVTSCYWKFLNAWNWKAFLQDSLASFISISWQEVCDNKCTTKLEDSRCGCVS